MIVQPDFLDHWKTLRLASVLSDQMAPVYIIRLWGYAQTRRCDLLPDDAEMVKAVCRWPGQATQFCDALVSCGWLERTQAGLLVHGWAELNARLIHNWTVGATGGRPRLQAVVPKGKPKGKPLAEPNETDKSRVDKNRVDEIDNMSRWQAMLDKYRALGVDVDREKAKAEAWLLTPKAKGRKMTQQFLANWLARAAQNDAPVPSNRTKVAPADSYAERQAQIHAQENV